MTDIEVQPQENQIPLHWEISKAIENNIRENVLILQQIFKRSSEGERNLLNKWFQDSVKNYIMEAYAAPLLRPKLQVRQIKSIKKIVHSNLQSDIPKYMGILNGYFRLIIQYNLQIPFSQRLLKVINLEPVYLDSQTKFNYNLEKELRKRFVCLMLLRFLEYFPKYDIPSFYELWNLAFPGNYLSKKKMSKFDARKNNVEKRVKKIKEIKKQGGKEKGQEEEGEGGGEMGIEQGQDLVGLKREYMVKSEEGEIPKERIDCNGLLRQNSYQQQIKCEEQTQEKQNGVIRQLNNSSQKLIKEEAINQDLRVNNAIPSNLSHTQQATRIGQEGVKIESNTQAVLRLNVKQEDASQDTNTSLEQLNLKTTTTTSEYLVRQIIEDQPIEQERQSSSFPQATQQALQKEQSLQVQQSYPINKSSFGYLQSYTNHLLDDCRNLIGIAAQQKQWHLYLDNPQAQKVSSNSEELQEKQQQLQQNQANLIPLPYQQQQQQQQPYYNYQQLPQNSIQQPYSQRPFPQYQQQVSQSYWHHQQQPQLPPQQLRLLPRSTQQSQQANQEPKQVYDQQQQQVCQQSPDEKLRQVSEQQQQDTSKSMPQVEQQQQQNKLISREHQEALALPSQPINSTQQPLPISSTSIQLPVEEPSTFPQQSNPLPQKQPKQQNDPMLPTHQHQQQPSKILQPIWSDMKITPTKDSVNHPVLKKGFPQVPANVPYYPQNQLQHPYQNYYPQPPPAILNHPYGHNLTTNAQYYQHHVLSQQPCPCYILHQQMPNSHELFGMCPFEYPMVPPPPCDHCNRYSSQQQDYYSYYLQQQQQHRNQATQRLHEFMMARKQQL